ncbi:MAG: hypothetical protein EBZ89_07670 [Chloroflexi bacterium]|nr:hypothetical protein [Chloroflexota bacterium]
MPTQVDDAPRTSGAVTTADTSASHLNRDGDVANPPTPTDNGSSLRKLRLDVIKLAWPVVVRRLGGRQHPQILGLQLPRILHACRGEDLVEQWLGLREVGGATRCGTVSRRTV